MPSAASSFGPREAYAPIGAAGGVGFKLTWESNAGTAESIGPDKSAVVRFVVLMRHFLNPLDRLHYDRIWLACQDSVVDGQSPELIAGVNAGIAALHQGAIALSVDGVSLSADEVYRTVSDGGFFGDDEVAYSFIERLSGAPAGAPLLWYMFVNYSVSAFGLMSFFFDTLNSAGAFEEGQPFGPFQCIYCLGVGGKFTSEEHVFPEALGNDQIVLAPGVVCDSCNNGVLAQLDQALVRFPPIALGQVQFVPHTKSGRLPTANFQNSRIEKTAPRNLRIVAKDKTGGIKKVIPTGGGTVRFSLNARAGRFDPRTLGRALCKVGLGLVAIEEGQGAARSERYTEVRRFISSGGGFANSLLLRTVGTPNPRVSGTRDGALPGTVFVFEIFGQMLAVNLETTPVLECTPEMVQARFVAHSLA